MAFSRRGFLKVLASVLPLSAVTVKSLGSEPKLNPYWMLGNHMTDMGLEHERAIFYLTHGDYVHGWNYPRGQILRGGRILRGKEAEDFIRKQGEHYEELRKVMREY